MAVKAALDRAALLRQDGATGPAPPDLAQDKGLRGAVHFRDRIDHALVVYLVDLVESVPEDLPRLSRHSFEISCGGMVHEALSSSGWACTCFICRLNPCRCLMAFA